MSTYASPDVKSSVGFWGDHSSTEEPANPRLAPNPCVVQPRTPLDQSPVDGDQASLSRGDLQDRPLGSEGTTIQGCCGCLGAFQRVHLLLSNRCYIESLQLAGGLGSQKRKSCFV